MVEKQDDVIDLTAWPSEKKAKRAKGGPIRAVFRALGSLQLAVSILMVLVFVLGGATFVESWHGTEFAQTNVYYSPWFIALQMLLAGNMLVAMLLRWPWKVRHTGFLMTHSGLMILLIGALQNYQSGTEGSLVFEEGQTADTITVRGRSQLTLTWSEGDTPRKRVLSFDPGPNDWADDTPLDFGEADNIAIQATGFYRHARAKRGERGRLDVTRADPEDEGSRNLEAAACFDITVGGETQQVWLVRTEWPQRLQTSKGPMAVSFGYAREPLGFSLTLLNFTRGKNPGGDAMGDASYTSQVRLVDEPNDVEFEREISMNEPLTYGKFTFYQSSFDKNRTTGTDISVLSAAHDPGSLLKYVGSVVLCLGTFFVFYLQRPLNKLFSSRASAGRDNSLATSESA